MPDPIRVTDFTLSHTDPGADAATARAARQCPASATGEVHASLIDAGEIGHPYAGDNIADLGWIEERTWWFRSTFSLSRAQLDAAAGAARLHLDRIDTVASVRLNDVIVGTHANAFRPAEFEVGAHLRAGENELLVQIDPPLSGADVPEVTLETMRRLARLFGRPENTTLVAEPRAVGVRKPLFSWGWDFAPRLPSIGLTGEVRITLGRECRITGVGFRTRALDLVSRTAEVGVRVDLETSEEVAAVRVRLHSPSGRVHTAVTTAADEEIALRIDEAEPWWTHDLGAPALYELHVELIDASDAVIAHDSRRVGIRTIDLDRSPDGTGRLFRFVLNGIPIFARGACVVPPDMMIGASAPERDAELVSLARGANMTMLRVWGGGGYGSDALYDAADASGLLIWQDFPFACVDYPEDPAMHAVVRAEAEHQVRRLRTHPALALLAGNNEVHAMHQAAWGDLDAGPWGHGYFHDILPALIDDLAPGTLYRPGSPWGEADPAGVNGVDDGDRHAWEVWHGMALGAHSPETYASQGEAMHFRRYRWDTGRFISEFGLLSAPTRETLSQWLTEAELRIDSPVLMSRIRDRPADKGLALLEIETGAPTDLDEYIRFTQAVQAEGLAYGIEHYRRRQPHTSGTLVWQLNEPWPGMSWSLVDYGMRTKPAYAAVRRAFAPVIASFQLTDAGALALWVVNSSLGDVTKTLSILLEDTAGEVRHRTQVHVAVAAGTSAVVWTLPDGIRPDADTVARVSDAEGGIPANRLFFAPIKDLPARWRDEILNPDDHLPSHPAHTLTRTHEGVS